MLLSTAYLPPLSYFAKIAAIQSVSIEKHEHFIKQTCRNRCYIYGANGKLPLTIPLINTHQKTPVAEKRIAYRENWQKLHWKSICSAYGNAPFFIYYKDEFAPFYEEKFEFLLNYNTALLKVALRLLKLKRELNFTSVYEINARDDFRNLSASKDAVHKPYHQVFSGKHGFIPDLGIIDLLFNTGPEAQSFLLPQS